MDTQVKEQKDFDLERFIEMFDEALTSNDERVLNALRSLMMMVVLTKPEAENARIGPLRQLLDDMRHLTRRLERSENEIARLRTEVSSKPFSESWDSIRYGYARDQGFTASQVRDYMQADVNFDYLNTALKKINSPKGK